MTVDSAAASTGSPHAASGPTRHLGMGNRRSLGGRDPGTASGSSGLVSSPLDAGSTPLRNAWEAEYISEMTPSPYTSQTQQMQPSITARSDNGNALTDLPQRVTFVDQDGLTRESHEYHGESSLGVTTAVLSQYNGRRSITKKEKYRINTQKLMQGVLDDCQRRAVQSVLCVNPYSLQGRCCRLVHSMYFDYAVSLLVVVNAVFIGIETQVRKCNEDFTFSGWYVVQVVFSLLFLAELGIRLFAERSGFVNDAWNIFDTVLVLATVSDTLVLHHLVTGSTLDLIVALRIARLARLVRIFRLLRFFKELWFLVAGIFDATRTLAWAWLLICFMTYIPAVFATRIFGQRHENNEYLQEQFGTIPRSMYTLFTVMTMEGWAEVARTTMNEEPWSWIFFVLFIFSTTFAIMNVVVAVIVQNTLEHASHCKDEERKNRDIYERMVLSKIVEVFEVADTDSDGELTCEEFLQSLDNKLVVRYLHEIGVDVRQAENLFDILDYDESGCLDLCEFVEGVLRARGEAKAKDILAIQCDLWKVERRLLDSVEEMSGCIQEELGLDGLAGAIESFKQDITEPLQTDSSSSLPDGPVRGPRHNTEP